MKNTTSWLIAVAILAGACAGCTTESTNNRYLDEFEAANKGGTTFTPATKVISGLNLTRAYRLQRILVARRQANGERLAGFKSGLMSTGSLAARHVSEPIVGALFVSGAVQSGGNISLCGYRRPALESKLGYVFRRSVTKPLSSIAELTGALASVRPVIELPDIAYDNEQNYQALDMVAANVTAARYVLGTDYSIRSLQPKELDELNILVTRDAVISSQGTAGESLGSQLPSLLIVVNQLIGRGYHIKPGMMVLTGKIGAKVNVVPGVYMGDFGELGRVKFAVRACN